MPKSAHPFLPDLPALVHTSVDSSVKGYVQESKDMLGLMQLDFIPYPTTPMLTELDCLFAKYALVPKPITCRLVIAGGDKLLHSFVCSYMRIQQLHPDWITGIKLKIFIVPWKTNDLVPFCVRLVFLLERP